MDQPVLQLDLSTSEGLLTMITGHLQPHLIGAFQRGGCLPMGVALIVTKYEGKPLDRPRSAIILSQDGEGDPASFLSRTYHWGARECGALGAVTFGQTWALLKPRAGEPERWKGRTLAEHPKAVEALVCVLEHTTLGVQSWISYVTRQPPISASPFESCETMQPTLGFLETTRAVS